MIKHKNQGQYTLALNLDGTLSVTGIYQAVAVAPFAGFITNIVAKPAKVVSAAGSAIYDLNKNDTTIFSSATKITVAGTTGLVTYGTYTTDPPQVAAGDIFSLDVDAIGPSHIGLAVLVTIDRQNSSPTGSATDLASLP